MKTKRQNSKLKNFSSLVASFLLFVVFSFNSLLLGSPLAETNYSDGNYGGGVYGATTAETTTSKADTSCSDTKPEGNNPWLYSANAVDGSSVTIRFTNWQSPVDHFVLEYGTESGSYQFGVDNFGDKNTNSYTIQSLTPNKTYFFRIRTGNGCSTGTWSNEIQVKTLNFFSFKTVAITDTSIQTKEGGTPASTETAGDGEEGKESDEKQGFDVNITVTDQELKPVEGAIVTLHSDPKEATTNENGIASFSNVEKGEHRVIIAYNNYEGEQTIQLTPDANTKQFDINITIQTKNVLLSKEVITIVGVSVFVITVLLVLLVRAKKKNKG